MLLSLVRIVQGGGRAPSRHLRSRRDARALVRLGHRRRPEVGSLVRSARHPVRRPPLAVARGVRHGDARGRARALASRRYRALERPADRPRPGRLRSPGRPRERRRAPRRDGRLRESDRGMVDRRSGRSRSCASAVTGSGSCRTRGGRPTGTTRTSRRMGSPASSTSSCTRRISRIRSRIAACSTRSRSGSTSRPRSA